MSLSERRKRRQELENEVKNNLNSGKTSTTGSTYSSSRAKRRAEMEQEVRNERLSTVSSELTSRIDTWFKNNENYINNYNSRFSGVTGSYTDPYDAGIKDWERTVKRQNLNFYAEADSIKSIIEENKDYLNPDWANEVLSSFDNALKVQRDIVNNSSERVKYFSNWDSEESYKRYQKISSIADMTSEQIKQYLSGDDPVAYVDDEGNEVTWDSLYKSKYYKEFTGKEDFADKSKSGYAAYEADIQSAAEREEAKKKDEKWYEKLGRYLGDAGPDTTLPNAGFIQATNDIRKDTSYMKPSNSWSQEQKDIYGYLYSTDKGAAAEYAQYANELNNQASNEKKTAAIEDWATKNGLTGSLATLGSIAMMPMSLVDSLGAMIEYGERGFISTSAEPLPGQVSGAITSAISKTLNQKYGTLNENAPVVGGKGWGDVYQLGTSIANSMISAYTQGSVGTFMVFFGSASASGMYEAKERGATDEQAITYGVLSGLAEAAGEAFSVDKLLGLAGVDELKSFFGNVLLQAGIEASEEGVTTLLNNFSDQLVMGDKSNFNVLVNYYMTEKKLSEEEAKRKAWADMANDLAFDMLGGAISGGTSAGLQTGIQTGVQGLYDTAKGKEYKNKFGADIGSALVGEAVEISPNSKFAQKMQAKVEGGNELSNRQVGKLVRQNETAMRDQDVSALRESVSNRLTELGETGNISTITEAIVKLRTGEKLSNTEKQTIKNSQFGQRVATEEENVGKGTHTSAWAEKYYSDRAAAHEDYSKALKGNNAASVAVKDAKGKTVTAEIQSVEADGEKATFTLSNGETVASDKVAFKTEDAKLVADIATERVSRVEGFTNEAATAMIKGYDGNISAVEYTEAFSNAFELGANNEPASKLVKVMNAGVSERVAHTAYVLGKESSKNVESVLKTDSKNGIINTNNYESEAGNENRESVHLRDSGKRNGSENSGRQISRVEGGSGQDQSRGEARHVADGEAARLVNEGREVKVADLGILGGSQEHTVRLVDRANETITMKKAREDAEARGLKVKFFVGDNLTIKGKDGNWFAARAYVKGEHVLVRADHPTLTSDQLMQHELGHDKVAKGEIDIDAVRERLIETVGKDKVDKVAEAYAEAYIDSGLSADEIWEECICDSLGDMNIFAGKNVVNDLLMEGMLPEINKAANETKSPAQTRGSPEGKASREVKRRPKVPPMSYFATDAMQWAYSVGTEIGERKFFYRDGKYVLIEKSDDGFVELGSYTNAQRKEIIKEIEEYNEAIREDLYTCIMRHEAVGEHDMRDNGNDERRQVGDGRVGSLHQGESDGNRSTSDEGGEHDNRSEVSSKYSSPEEAKASGKVSDAKFSIEFADDIANKQRQFAADGLSRISSEELERAIADTAHMVNEMKPYANILPQDKVGKTLVKNGSYDVSVENTTVCIRTLAYNSFVDMVSEKVGRPLTQMESFLVSQKLYDIAKEPQCLYCYVSLDRKAFNEMVIRYTEQRDAAIAAYDAAGKPKLPSSFNAEWSLFKEFLAGRKPTKNMWDRYVGWINAHNNGERLVSLSDISTEAKRLELVEGGGEIASQVKDILKYAQSASWAKKQTQYVAYYDEILKLKPAVIRNLNNHYGMRWYSFSDYSGAFIVENMQQITDAAIRGLKGLSYTKDTDFAEIFAPTGMNINISVYAKKTESGYEIDAKQSANIDEAIKLREQYPNVGIVVVATDKAGVEWALAQEWSDVVIPFHTVRTGADVAEFYNWEIFNAEQNDTVSDQNLWDAYTRDVGKKKASKMVYPSEHQNNRETYLSICEQRGLTPRFKSFLENPNYMKLVNETRQSEGQTSPLKAVYNLEAAERSFDKFVEKGGYYEGWYNDGIDVDGEADIVAEDVRAGKRANEVGYGRQDINFEDVAKGRKTNREHGKASRELDFLDFMEQQTDREVLANAFESVAQNDVEKAKLKDYRENINRLNTEEEKLMKLRAEIKELSFAKGARDISKIAELRTEAEKTANRIGIYDKRLLTLEASKPLRAVLEREKQKSYNRAKAEARADLDAYRARALVKQEELKTRYQESKKRGVEGRHKTEIRHKIKSEVSELNTLLLNPTAKKHIKEELRRGVAEALSAFNMDTVGAEERLAEINRKLQAETDPYEIEHLLESYNRIKNQGENLKEKLEKLNSAYEKIKDTDDIELNLAYQEIIQNSIKAVSEKVGDTSIRDMTLEQLEMVYDLFKMIRHTIRDANKAFNAKKALTITQMAEATNQEVRTVGGQPYQRNVVSATLQRMGWSLLKPYVAFRTIGSDTFTDLYRELRNGEDTFYKDLNEAQAFIEDQYDKHGFKNWDMKATKTFKSKSGKEFELTLEQMMTLYAYSKREQAHAHIMEGGIVFEDALVVKKNKLGVPIKYEVTTKDAFNLSVETFTEIASSLTEEQKAFVDAMQAYLSEDMGAKGNEISMKLLGVKLFKERFYLPIKSSKYYMNFKAEEAGEVKLRSPAFSKETVQHANNPIVLHNFTDLWAEHINDMSMYHSFVLALEDFTRVYNYKTRTDANVETMDTKATLETAYPGVTNYINKFLKDMNGGVRVETVGWAERMTSLAKKGSVLGSASVAIQQPSAVMRAMAYINPKYFVGEKVSEGMHKEKWEELKKYAPVAGIKEMGRFDVGMGQSTSDWIKADKNLLEKAEDFLSLPPAFMDEVTWITIWNAVKRETAHNYPKLATSSEAFLTLAGERFTDVISLSQVYDSVFSRSDIMRNKSWIAKSLTAFMAEPTTTLNMLWDSAVQGKRTGNIAGTTVKTGGAVMAAIVFNSILKSFVMAMRDDEEDESYIEKYFERFVGDLKDNLNPLNLIPFVKDVWSIYKGYDVERMDMALFSDFKDAIDAFDSDNKTLYDKWSGLIGAASAFFGVPVKNLERDVRALFNTIFGYREETTLEGMLYAIEKGWTGDEKSNGQQLYEAMLKGDTKHIERVKARFEDQDDIDSAVYKALKENDVRIKEAAKARENGDIAGFTAIAKEIIAEGIFSQDNVVAAINSEVRAFSSKISAAASAKLSGEEKEYRDILKGLIETYKGVYTGKEIEETIEVAMSNPQESTESDKIKSIYVVDDFYKAVRGNDLATAYAVREDIIGAAVDNGKSKKAAEQAFESSIASFVGDKYKSGLIEDSGAAEVLVDYAGLTEAEAASRIRYWAFVTENPEYKDLSESAVNKYYDGLYKKEEEKEVLYCKSAQSYGITLDIYAEYIREKSGLSKKEDIMYIINTLPLTSSQKDALYYLNGWAKSTIREAPWR